MKRIVGMVMGCLMLLTFAACKGKTESAAKGPVAIEFWYGLGGGLGEAMDAIIKQYNASQNEVAVTGVQQSDYDETVRQIQAGVAAGQVPASALMGFQALKTFMERGITEILDDYIAAYPDFNKNDIVPSFLAYCVNDKNQVYGLPAYGTTQVIYYRMDTFRDAGADPDEVFKTWQSLAEFSARVARKERGETVFFGFMPMGAEANLPDVAYSNGARHLSDDERTVLIDSREWIEAVESMRKWVNEDKIFGIHYGGQGWEYWYKTIDDVLQGRAAGYLGSAGDRGDLDFSIVASHIQPGFGSHSPKPYADCLTLTILAGADKEQKEAAFKWLTYLTSAPVTAQWSLQTGYIPVRSSSVDVPEYAAYIKEHPEVLVPLRQAEIARKNFDDPTGGKISDALGDAFELVMIENVPAATALGEAQKIAQAALDEYWAEK